MPAANHPLFIETGETFDKTLTWYQANPDPVLAKQGVPGPPVNLTSYTAKMQIRKMPSDDLIVELTTENGKIELGGSAGTIRLLLTKDETAAFDPTPLGYYSLILYASGTEKHLLEGSFRIKGDATR